MIVDQRSSNTITPRPSPHRHEIAAEVPLVDDALLGRLLRVEVQPPHRGLEPLGDTAQVPGGHDREPLVAEVALGEHPELRETADLCYPLGFRFHRGLRAAFSSNASSRARS